MLQKFSVMDSGLVRKKEKETKLMYIIFAMLPQEETIKSDQMYV